MNSELRLLCIRDSQLNQYPTDFMRKIFLTYVHEIKEQSQIFVHRDTNMMHYTYICKLSKTSNDFFGISLTFNSVRVKDINRLFNIFETTLDNIVSKAILLDMNSNAEMYFKSDFLYSQTEIKRIKEFMDDLFDKNKSCFEALEAPNYSISDKEVAIISLEKDSPKQIDFMLRNYCNIRIFKQHIAYSTIYRLKSEIKELEYKHKELSSEISNLSSLKYKSLEEIKDAKNELLKLRKKEPIFMYLPAILFIILIAGAVLFCIVNDERKSLRTEYKFLASKYPIKITNIEIANVSHDGSIETDYGQTIYSKNTMYLTPRIQYIGTQSKNITLKVKLYDTYGRLSTGSTSPLGYTFQDSVHIYSYPDEITLSGFGNNEKGYWPAGLYRMEIWYNDVCLGTKTFRII